MISQENIHAQLADALRVAIDADVLSAMIVPEMDCGGCGTIIQAVLLIERVLHLVDAFSKPSLPPPNSL